MQKTNKGAKFYDKNKVHEGALYGVYEGILHSTVDPQRKGRVQVRIPHIIGERDTDYTVWCNVSTPTGGEDAGCMITPEKKDNVICLVQFMSGDINKPVVTGFINAGNPQDPDTPKESKEFCDGTKCKICEDKEINAFNKNEHIPYHNHKDTYYCGKVKTLYKSPLGASIVIGERGEEEFFRITDRGGQVFEMSSPIKKDKSEKRGLKNSIDGTQFDTEEDVPENKFSSITLMDLSHQLLKLIGKFEEEQIIIENRNKSGNKSNKITCSVKKDDEYYKVEQKIGDKTQVFEISAKNGDEFMRLLDCKGNFLFLDSVNDEVKIHSIKDGIISVENNLIITGGNDLTVNFARNITMNCSHFTINSDKTDINATEYVKICGNTVWPD